jgi:trehalose 6-phosphate synthase
MFTLRLQLRFLVPLALTLVAAVCFVLPATGTLALRWFSRDAGIHGALVATALSDSIAEALADPQGTRLQLLLNRAARDQQLAGIGVCSIDGRLLSATAGFPASLNCAGAQDAARRPDHLLAIPSGSVYVGVSAVNVESGHVADLVLLHNLSLIEHRSEDTRNYLILLIVILGAAIAAVTMVAAQLSWRNWISGARALLHGQRTPQSPEPATSELAPIAAELRTGMRDFEDEIRRAKGADAAWNPERLRSLLRTTLRGDEILVVSNREPYIHETTPEGIAVRRPASGLVTAVEPVMRACSGTWIAHGSGNADRLVVDALDHVPLPPGRSEYTLRRIWLTAEEEKEYYEGFANEGLWPLCHVAHVRPVFREKDWRAYVAVNQRFADAVVKEARSEDPVVLVQDYHFALLPAMVRARLPRATILSFWHIPWPNPESFGICPWRREILQGMLGSTIFGFQTRFHCQNFIETVDRYVEARIEHEHSMISFHDADTLVENYPISIEWPDSASSAALPSVEQCRANVVARLGIKPGLKIALGIDRLDYTKGILERIRAVEHVFETYPEWIGKLVLVQIAAPSRASLEEYRSFKDRLEELAAQVNQRFGTPDYQPVQLIVRHHDHDAVVELYRAADVCLVTSLHDGMNLVCKEFVAARDDQRGVLILSQFAGAAREMTEALIVNPYHVEECAAALQQALVMPEAEQRERMASLRMAVRECNVYRWAGRMLTDAGRLRLRQRVDERVQRHHAA